VMCFGPVWSAVMNGRLMSYCWEEESTILAFSDSSLITLNGVGLFREVNAGVGFEFIKHPVHETVVPVIAPEVCVPVGCFDFKHTISDFENGDIESTATEIVNGDFFVLLFIETVRRAKRPLVR